MLKKIFNIFTSIILVLLIVVVIFVFTSRISGKSPGIFGYHIFRVSTASMEPVLMVGDVILDKEVEPSQINIGDIISYYGKKGDYNGKIITHKVVNKNQDANGTYHFITKGITEGAIEDPEIFDTQIVGKFQSKIPVLNWFYSFFTSSYGLIVMVILIVGLFGYELISLIFSYKSLKDTDDNDIDYLSNQGLTSNDENLYPNTYYNSDNEIFDEYKSLDEDQNNRYNSDNNKNGFQ